MQPGRKRLGALAVHDGLLEAVEHLASDLHLYLGRQLPVADSSPRSAPPLGAPDKPCLAIASARFVYSQLKPSSIGAAARAGPTTQDQGTQSLVELGDARPATP